MNKLLTKQILDLIKSKNQYIKGIYEYNTSCWLCYSKNLSEPLAYHYKDITIWWYDCLDCGQEMDKEGGDPPKLVFNIKILEEYEKQNNEWYLY